MKLDKPNSHLSQGQTKDFNLLVQSFQSLPPGPAKYLKIKTHCSLQKIVSSICLLETDM